MIKKMQKPMKYTNVSIKKWTKEEKNIEKPKNKKCYKNIEMKDQKFKVSNMLVRAA